MRKTKTEAFCPRTLTPTNPAVCKATYTGSDIVGIICAPKRRALRRCVERDEKPLLTRADMEQGLKKKSSSAMPELLVEHDRFNKPMNRLN